MADIQSIELNPEFQKALHWMERTGKHVFVTGRAGTGKSTLLEYYRVRTKKQVAVLAPTGVAAVNVRGETIHSFFGFKPDISQEKVRRLQSRDERRLYEKLDTVVIDEVSMVRADLMDCVEKFLRLNVNKHKLFGGVQMVFIGDLYQLPPVVTREDKEAFNSKYASPYFFASKAFADDNFNMEFVELQKIYRQTDNRFIDILNKVRNNSITPEEVEELNQACYQPDFQDRDDELFVYLTPTNRRANEINERKLSELPGEELVYQGEINGEFKPEYLPTSQHLRLKEGAQVMMLNNDPGKRWVNGSIGLVEDVEYDPDLEADVLWIGLVNGAVEPVMPFTWRIYHYIYNPDTGNVESESIGTFRQYPLKLAWAVTVHKSQGKTFDRVVLDIDRGMFAHGQMYVALSRCTTLDGLVLKKPIAKKSIWMDWRVVKFVTQYQYGLADKELPLEEKTKKIQSAIDKGRLLSILYLKANDTRSERKIRPFFVGELKYRDKPFIGVKAYCMERGEERTFRVDRILKIK